MHVIKTAIPEVLIIEPQIFGDERGFFFESWQQDRYCQHGIDANFVQDNQAYSRYGVLRGLHIQQPFSQGKLVWVTHGEVFDVAVDIRHGSPWFGQWTSCILNADNKRQFWIPKGFAHGYMVTSPDAHFVYKCSDTYHPETQYSVRWDDPDLNIAWPTLSTPPQLSQADKTASPLHAIPKQRLPPYTPAQ
jgi:dTDP-4-dehydrorhamnose 3,5-epimerase